MQFSLFMRSLIKAGAEGGNHEYIIVFNGLAVGLNVFKVLIPINCFSVSNRKDSMLYSLKSKKCLEVEFEQLNFHCRRIWMNFR